MGDSAVANGVKDPSKDEPNKMEQEVLKNVAAKAATARRAEGGNTSEPQLDFDRQDQAVQYVSRPRVKTDPSRDALLTASDHFPVTLDIDI